MSISQISSRVMEGVRGPIVSALAAIGLQPNHVTVIGTVAAAAGGCFAAQGMLFLAGIIFLLGSLLDGLDGALARRMGRTSRFGAFLDSVMDRVGEGLLLFGVLVYALRQNNDLAAAMSFLAVLFSFLVSYTRARAEGLGMHGNSGFAPRPVRILLLVAGLLTGRAGLVTAATALVAVLSLASSIQRGWEVWQQTKETPPR